MQNKFNRSTLYNLEPIGLGTLKVESFTSYIYRLSKAHNVKVSTLLGRLALYDSKEGFNKNKSANFVKYSSVLNNLGEKTQILIDKFNELTGRNDLSDLTLGSIYHISAYGRGIRAKRTWCPNCLFMDEICNREKYERLVWCFDFISICPFHDTGLLTICPQCKSEQNYLPSTTPLFYCQSCNSSLYNDVCRK